MKERWNWSYPVVFSSLPPHALYIGSQSLWRSMDEGQSWAKISPDLTRADPETLGETGGPIRPDQDGPEVYGTIFTIAPSPLRPQLIWTGSDDGLVHVTRDDGKSWDAVTPKDLPKHTRISFIHASAHDPATAYLAAKRYELGDRQPYLYRTRDYGASWTRIDKGLNAGGLNAGGLNAGGLNAGGLNAGGLNAGDVTHAIVEDSDRKGLLFVGTEHGVRISFDDGGTWNSLSLNLPDTHVSGLKVVGNELAIATHGRSFFVLEGLETLRHLAAQGRPGDATFFPPAAAVLDAIPARLNFYLDAATQAASMTVMDGNGAVVRSLGLPARMAAGAHSVGWDLRHDGATVFEDMILEAPSPATGPLVLPGRYKVMIDLGDRQLKRDLDVTLDPRLEGLSRSGLEAQHALALEIRDAVSAANRTVLAIRSLRGALGKRSVSGALGETKRAFVADISAVEAALYQVRNQSPKDKIAYPIQLNDRLAHLMDLVGLGRGAPTAAQRQVFAELKGELDGVLGRYEALLKDGLPKLNRDLQAAGQEPVLAR
jgi:hypothetical protein